LMSSNPDIAEHLLVEMSRRLRQARGGPID
jgi:CRP-like cAMP-binding protein